MSNPGVIELFNFQFADYTGYRYFRVTDNIGEGIHLYIDAGFRLKLTIKEFRALADDMLDAINASVNVEGFDARKQDPLFLFEIAEYLPYLREVKMEYMPVKDIIVDTNAEGDKKIYRYIKHSHVVKALRGDLAENDMHDQINFLGQNNRQRLLSIFESVYKNGYPFNDEYIILFNNQNIVRDGQHRAGSIYFMKPDAVIPIQRWIFADNMFNVPDPVFDLS